MADRNSLSQNVPSKGQQDDVRTAPEEGDPAFSGRTHGGDILGTDRGPAGKEGSPDAGGIRSGAGKQTGAGPKGNSGKVGEDIESGRQGTA
ncbi:MAG TPA: hypothetical protein VL475_00350 [Planctomycetaceae bacterium]|nr:hypothetical protein [Planctomycetaceae bacterium]